MFEELDIVELTHDIKKHNLKEGEKGTIVEVYKDGEAYEVEFVAPDGKTTILLTLMKNDIRSTINKDEYLFRGFNAPVYVSTASVITFTVGAENVLRGLDTIFGINESRIETESEKGIKEFHYSVATP